MVPAFKLVMLDFISVFIVFHSTCEQMAVCLAFISSDLIQDRFIPANASRSIRWLREPNKPVGNKNDIASVIAVSDCVLTRGPFVVAGGLGCTIRR